MRISSKDENSLRIMQCLAKRGRLSITQISEIEGITAPNVAKIARLLRKAELLVSINGKQGGYELSRPSNEIFLDSIIKAVDGSLYNIDYCDNLKGECTTCVHIDGCSIRPIWSFIQSKIDDVLTTISLEDLENSEKHVVDLLN